MRTADFDYHLPPELIAQHPAPQRDQSRLLVLHRNTALVEHHNFPDLLEYLKPGDVLVMNNSRVIPARLRGVNSKTGGQFEILLLEENAANDWWAMMKPGKRARVGTQIQIGNRQPARDSSESAIGNILATVLATNDEGHRRLQFQGTPDILNELDQLGEIPLPPYIRRAIDSCSSRRKEALTQSAIGNPLAIHRSRQSAIDVSLLTSAATDRERYQTVFANPPGSVAAPTAGLHFTKALLDELRAYGVHICFVTLHVGLGTFAPVKAETLSDHAMHEERYEITEATVRTVNEAKSEGRRVIAVGTTSVRVLESAARGRAGSPLPADGAHGVTRPTITPGQGRTRIFIYPPCDFKIVDALLTNFHLPRSTLLMLISAFATPGKLQGRETILAAYAQAIRERYRFFSYGDAMLIL